MNSHLSGPGPGSGLRGYLLGAWSVDRTMRDRQSGSRGTFTGVVRFSEPDPELGPGDGGVLFFHEQGTVRWTASGGSPFTGPATRDYVLRTSESPETLDVFFPDGRPFHRMSFTAAASEQHWCDPDTYRVKYTLVGRNEFRYTWDVSGPSKDLLLESVLRRMDPRRPDPQESGSRT